MLPNRGVENVLRRELESLSLPAEAEWLPRTTRKPVASHVAWVALGATLLVTALVGGNAIAQNWFSEVFRSGNLSAAASRPVSLAEARTTGLPLPSSSQLPGGWTLHDKGAVQLTRTPSWTTVELQYDRAGQRGMNIRTASGLRLFDPARGRYDEILDVSGAPVYVRRESHDGYDFVRAYFNVREATVEIWAFGPALTGRPFTSAEIAELVRIWLSQ